MQTESTRSSEGSAIPRVRAESAFQSLAKNPAPAVARGELQARGTGQQPRFRGDGQHRRRSPAMAQQPKAFRGDGGDTKAFALRGIRRLSTRPRRIRSPTGDGGQRRAFQALGRMRSLDDLEKARRPSPDAANAARSNPGSMGRHAVAANHKLSRPCGECGGLRCWQPRGRRCNVRGVGRHSQAMAAWRESVGLRVGGRPRERIERIKRFQRSDATNARSANARARRPSSGEAMRQRRQHTDEGPAPARFL